MNRFLEIAATLAATFGTSFGVWADEAPMVTDRPDFTESATVVPKGSVQLEAGVTWASFEEEGRYGSSWDLLSLPEALIRWGIGDRLELRFGLPNYFVERFWRYDVEEWGDLSIGVKWELGAVKSPWDFALIAELDLPTSTIDGTADTVDPSAIFIVGRDLGERWSFGAQVGAAREFLTNSRFGDWHVDVVSATVVFGVAVGDRHGTFFEVAAENVNSSFYANNEDESLAQFHHGWTYAVSPTFQLDIHGAIGLTDDGPEWLIGAGFAKRW